MSLAANGLFAVFVNGTKFARGIVHGKQPVKHAHFAASIRIIQP